MMADAVGNTLRQVLLLWLVALLHGLISQASFAGACVHHYSPLKGLLCIPSSSVSHYIPSVLTSELALPNAK